jgi:2-dehydropantoate 2-reductase
MKVCVFGAGAIGGYMATALVEGGADVSIVARGPHLAAIKDKGLRIQIGGQEKSYSVQASDNASDLGEQDYVIIALKAHSVPPIVEKLSPLIGSKTAIVTAMNGVPWWYFHDLAGDYQNKQLETVDPGGKQWSLLGPERAIGCVVYPACEIEEPGLIRHIDGNRFTLGEPSGEKTDRATAISKAMIAGGLKAPVRPKIRDEIWVKLWGNLCFNPVSALTGMTLEEMATEPTIRALCRSMMLEAQEIGEKLGVRFAIDVDKRIDGAKAVGAHKTSMLQDLELGRPMEIDALVTAVQEMGQLVGTPTPNIDTVLALVQQRAKKAGCY